MENSDYAIAVSACLMGENCRYDGGNCRNALLIEKLKGKKVLLLCPEVMGNLSIPRLPSEIRGNKVINSELVDVSENFHLGASKALALLKKYQIKTVVLKDKSPSCGSLQIYDGSFNAKIIEGQGIFAKLCLENGIEVLSEKTLERL